MVSRILARRRYVRLLDKPVVIPAGATIMAATEARFDTAAPAYSVTLALVDEEVVSMIGEFSWGGVKGATLLTDELCRDN